MPAHHADVWWVRGRHRAYVMLWSYPRDELVWIGQGELHALTPQSGRAPRPGERIFLDFHLGGSCVGGWTMTTNPQKITNMGMIVHAPLAVDWMTIIVRMNANPATTQMAPARVLIARPRQG
jgi:hypothetical protein